MARGKLIVFEGPDGVGKSTVMAEVAKQLVAQGQPCVRSREPGGSPAAEHLRSALLAEPMQSTSSLSQLLLITAARVAHLEQTINPALQRGDWVLCDRYVDSSYVYQCRIGGVPTALLDALNDLLSIPRPDLRLFFSVEASTALQRLGQRTEHNRFDTRNVERWNVLAEHYAEQSRQQAETARIIEANGAVEDVVRRCVEVLNGAF